MLKHLKAVTLGKLAGAAGLAVALLLLALTPYLSPAATTRTLAKVTEFRVITEAASTQVALELNVSTREKVFTLDQPNRVVIDLANADLLARLPAPDGVIKGVRSARRPNGELRIVLEVASDVSPRAQWRSVDGKARLMVELVNARASAVSATAVEAHSATAPGPAASSASPEPAPVKSVGPAVRDLVIAIDAGHGGEDPGALGRRGAQEKNITLAIARLLKERIDAEPGMRAVLTRDGDYFVPLRDRINRARQHQADMFVSIHADSVRDSSVRGSSVYTLSAKGATNEAARFLADRENAADLVGGVSLDDKNNVLASVLLDLTQGASMSASMDAAARVLRQLDQIGNTHHSQVQQAGFVVLKSPDIPSMLVETAFISNPIEEARLIDPRHQARIADAVMAGVRDYFYTNAPPGTRVAQLKALRQARAD